MEKAWDARENWQSMGLAGREVVEQTIPKDPAASFAKEIMSCVGSQAQPVVSARGELVD